MNNKSLIILLVLAVFLVTGCKETHNRAIDIAYQLTATSPDSALSVLDGVNQAKLGKAEMARYALVYTIAQDKSGLGKQTTICKRKIIRVQAMYNPFNSIQQWKKFQKPSF